MLIWIPECTFLWTGKHSPGFFVLKSELLLCKIKIPCEKEIAVPLLFYKEEKCRHLLQNIGRGSNEC